MRMPFGIDKTNAHRYAAEAFGTFALVFIGCGAAVLEDWGGAEIGDVGVGLAFGLIVMAMVYSIGKISGAHLNPAVTLGFFFAKRLDKREIVRYVVFQLLGAFVAALLLQFLLPRHISAGLTVPLCGVARAFVLEIVLSFLLMFVILNVCEGHKIEGLLAGIAVGGTVTLALMMGGSISGASMNPARSLAPAVISGKLGSIWIYLVSPVIGVYLAHPAYRLVHGLGFPSPEEEEKPEPEAPAVPEPSEETPENSEQDEAEKGKAEA